MLRSWAIFRGVLLPRLSLQVALGVGVAGALVDVSSYARLDDGLLRRWGRDDAFSDLEPGTFSFVLDNADGRFTPENASSPLSTKLSEGLRACVSVGGRLTAGTVRSVEPEFPGGSAAWATVRVTCQDGLGDAARLSFPDVTRGAAFAVGCGAFWPFDDAPGSTSFAGVTGIERSLYATGAMSVTYGVDATVPGGPPQATLSAAAGAVGSVVAQATPGVFYDSIFGGSDTFPFFGAWVTPRNATSFLEFSVFLPTTPVLSAQVRFGVQNDRFAVWDSSTASYVFSGPFSVNSPHYLAVDAAGSFWVNGVRVHQWVNVGVAAGADITITVGSATFGDTAVSVSNLHATASRVRADAIVGGSNSTMYELVAQTTGLPYAAAPSDLSETTVGGGNVDGSALDFLNQYLLTEQGHAYMATTGTLTSPTATLTMRARTRPVSVSYSFDIERDLSGAPEFVRDLTNLVSRVTVAGPDASTVVDDQDLVARAGRSSDSADTLAVNDRDRLAWGQDRLIRGANTQMRIASVVVDAMTTPTDRSADLLALLPGDRVRFTNLPSPILGFSTWDGWFLGARETHTTERHEFELFFTPVLPDTAVYMSGRSNLWPNPSAETNGNGWVVFGSRYTQTLSTAQEWVGNQSLQYVRATTATDTEGTGFFGSGNGPADLAAMEAGQTYTGSLYIRSTTERYLTLGLNFRTAGGAGLSDVISNEFRIPANTWTRMSVTATAPATTALGGLRVRQGASGNQSYTTGVETFWVDGALIELGNTLGAYFDGATTQTGFDYRWVGTAHASVSTEELDDADYRFMDNGELTLSALINSSTTTVSIATSGDQLTTTDLPLTVQIDDEQLTVTACTSATPQVATVTRGVNGTTAASHTSGAAVTVLPDSIYAF